MDGDPRLPRAFHCPRVFRRGVGALPCELILTRDKDLCGLIEELCVRGSGPPRVGGESVHSRVVDAVLWQPGHHGNVSQMPGAASLSATSRRITIMSATVSSVLVVLARMRM